MYKTIPITDDDFYAPTLAAWSSEAESLGEEGVFLQREVESRLTSLRAMSEQDENIHGYLIVKTGENIASSLLETSHAMPRTEKAWLKLLHVTLRPTLLPSYNGDGDIKVMQEAFQVVSASVMHSAELIFHAHPAKQLKIFGRTAEMVLLFKALVTVNALESVLETIGLTARLEGKWLVLAKVE